MKPFQFIFTQPFKLRGSVYDFKKPKDLLRYFYNTVMFYRNREGFTLNFNEVVEYNEDEDVLNISIVFACIAGLYKLCHKDLIRTALVYEQSLGYEESYRKAFIKLPFLYGSYLDGDTLSHHDLFFLRILFRRLADYEFQAALSSSIDFGKPLYNGEELESILSTIETLKNNKNITLEDPIESILKPLLS